MYRTTSLSNYDTTQYEYDRAVFKEDWKADDDQLNLPHGTEKQKKTRMWADAQRDGRPVEYR